MSYSPPRRSRHGGRSSRHDGDDDPYSDDGPHDGHSRHHGSHVSFDDRGYDYMPSKYRRDDDGGHGREPRHRSARRHGESDRHHRRSHHDDDKDHRYRDRDRGRRDHGRDSKGSRGSERDRDRDSRSSSHRHHHHDRSRARSAPADVANEPSLMRMAASAALTAGGIEALKVRHEPGPWVGDKGRRVVTAALGAAAVNRLVDKGLEGKPHRQKAGSAIGGLIINQLLNGRK